MPHTKTHNMNIHISYLRPNEFHNTIEDATQNNTQNAPLSPIFPWLRVISISISISNSNSTSMSSTKKNTKRTLESPFPLASSD